MRKTIILCDLCKKELQENEVMIKPFEFRRYEVCEECGAKIDNAQHEIDLCIEKRNEEMEKIIKRYGLGHEK